MSELGDHDGRGDGIIVMDRKDSRYYLNLPYPENLIRTVCDDEEAEITEDRILGLEFGLETLAPREQDVLDARFKQRKCFREISESLGIAADRVRVIYNRSLRKLRTTYRFSLIKYGYHAAEWKKKKEEEAEKRADEEAYTKAVESIGNPELMTMLVKELDLPVRITNRFKEYGIETVKDLWIISQRHSLDYNRIRGLGELGQKEIKDQLRGLGFNL